MGEVSPAVQGQIALRDAHGLILLGGCSGSAAFWPAWSHAESVRRPCSSFLVLGMLAGADGLIGIPVHDFRAAYLVGSVALAIILFEGGVKMPLARLRTVFWPALLLATVGVALTAGVLGVCIALLFGVSLPAAILVGLPPRRLMRRRSTRCCAEQGLPCRRAFPHCLRQSPVSTIRCPSFSPALLLHIIVSPQNLSVGERRPSSVHARRWLAVRCLVSAGGWLLAFALRVLRLDHAVAGSSSSPAR